MEDANINFFHKMSLVGIAKLTHATSYWYAFISLNKCRDLFWSSSLICLSFILVL